MFFFRHFLMLYFIIKINANVMCNERVYNLPWSFCHVWLWIESVLALGHFHWLAPHWLVMPLPKALKVEYPSSRSISPGDRGAQSDGQRVLSAESSLTFHLSSLPCAGKHPVSALIELCNKRRILQPEFVMVHHSGPDHRKNFLFKVRRHSQCLPNQLTMTDRSQ